MKQIIFSLTLLLFALKSFSQTQMLSKDYYLHKSKNQKTTGWVMLGGGAAMAIIGSLIADSDIKKTRIVWYDGILFGSGRFSYTAPGSISGSAVFFTVAGIGAALGSIPFFISSSKNARKAATISFNNQNILLLQQNSFVSKAQPTVTLKISL